MRRKSRFQAAAVVLAFVLLLTACGNSGGGNGASPETSEPPAGSPSASAASTDSAGAAAFRDYETDKGTVRIPTKPQRIVTDYYGGELLSVGANVVGVEPTTFDNPFLKGMLDGAEDVGADVDPEKTLALKPDLIVVMYDKNYEALSKIAPTIHIPYGTATNIEDTVKLFGDIVGAPDKAEEFLAKYEQKAAEGREKLKGVVDENATVGLYELTDKGELWMFGDNAGRGGQAVYNALQLKMPEKIKSGDQTKQISLELLPDYAADYMFMTTYDPEKKGEELAKFKASPIWKNIPAVQKNRFFFNDFDTYYRYDPIAIMGQIDLFVDMLLEANGKKEG